MLGPIGGIVHHPGILGERVVDVVSRFLRPFGAPEVGQFAFCEPCDQEVIAELFTDSANRLFELRMRAGQQFVIATEHRQSSQHIIVGNVGHVEVANHQVGPQCGEFMPQSQRGDQRTIPRHGRIDDLNRPTPRRTQMLLQASRESLRVSDLQAEYRFVAEHYDANRVVRFRDRRLRSAQAEAVGLSVEDFAGIGIFQPDLSRRLELMMRHPRRSEEIVLGISGEDRPTDAELLPAQPKLNDARQHRERQHREQ